MRVHDLQAYRKTDVTRERISCISELREILLSFQTGFILMNASVVYAILENISGLEPSLVITEPRYLKLMTVSSFCPFTLISVLTYTYHTSKKKSSFILSFFLLLNSSTFWSGTDRQRERERVVAKALKLNYFKILYKERY